MSDTPRWYAKPEDASEHDGLGFSVVDRFLVVAPSPQGQAHSEQGIANLAEILQMFRAEYEVVLDFTQPGIAFRDFAEVLSILGVEQTRVLTSPESMTSALRLPFYNTKFLHLRSTNVPWQSSQVNLRVFDNPVYDYPNGRDEGFSRRLSRYEGVIQEDEDVIDWAKAPRGVRQKVQRDQLDRKQLSRWRLLRELFGQIATNSLLTEFTLQCNNDQVTLSPTHQHACYDAKQTDSGIVVARPSIIAKKTGTLFSGELADFTATINTPGISERDIQRCLERNPRLLQSLGYSRIKPHVVLGRTGNDPLIPDFFLQPIGSQFWDILDIKLPKVKTYVGSRNRLRFSSDIVEVAAQLREYSAYFENEQWAVRIEQLTGIRCYKPKLIALVGREEEIIDFRQARRLHTQYSDIKVVSFDSLVKVATERLLI